MTVPLIAALHAAETLAAFHRNRAEDSLGAACDRHLHLALKCAEETTRAIVASSVTVEHQADAVRRHDIEIAQRIIDRHVIMHGVGMPADDVPAARRPWRETSRPRS